jgi:hypothetical protein
MKDSIIEELCEMLKSRSEVGIKKYGVTLDRNDLELRDWLQHQLEETLDSAGYILKAIKMLDDEKISKVLTVEPPNHQTKIQKVLDEREWNYYFDEGAEVKIDDVNFDFLKPETDFFDSTTHFKIQSHLGKKGIVKKVSTDLHAFGRGSSYNMDVEFDGVLVEHIWAPYIISYE